MATLDQDDLNAIQAIVSAEILDKVATIADAVLVKFSQLPITPNVFDAEPIIIELPNDSPIIFS